MHHWVVRGPPVCNAVHCGFPGRCAGPKLYQRVPSRQLRQLSLGLSIQTHLPQNAQGKKEVEENANVSYFETQKTTRALV